MNSTCKNLCVFGVGLLISFNLHAMWLFKNVYETTLSDMPNYVLQYIANFLPHHAVQNLCDVNKRCRASIAKPQGLCKCKEDACEIKREARTFDTSLKTRNLDVETKNYIARIIFDSIMCIELHTESIAVNELWCNINLLYSLRNIIQKLKFGSEMSCYIVDTIYGKRIEINGLCTAQVLTILVLVHQYCKGSNEVQHILDWLMHEINQSLPSKLAWLSPINIAKYFDGGKQTSFNKLPVNVLEHIAHYMHKHDIRNLRLVNKHCSQITRQQGGCDCVICYLGLDKKYKTH